MPSVINVSTYLFAPLSDLKALKDNLTSLCKKLALKGTILLSQEGINLFVSGSRDNIDVLIGEIRRVPGLEGLAPKLSESGHQPFTRMLVKIKKEIIAFGVPGIDPGKRTSPKLKAVELKKWLDEGREVTLLDTRNDYEVKLGTFKNALPIGVNHFRDFPEAVRKLPPEMKEKPIVMFCTGGIRCEKAGPFMEQEGFKHIFQLDGGILKYFEEVGEKHYEGGCFVFDQRVGVDPTLAETEDKQCFLCLSPLTVADQKDARYKIGVSCPYCFKTSQEKMRESIASHHAKLRKLTEPLPGSAPYDNYRPLKVPKAYDGYKLFDFITAILPHISKDIWEKEFKLGHFTDNFKNTVSQDRVVKAGDRYLHLIPHSQEPDVNAAIEILYEDEAIIVVNKPAPLPTHASGRFNRNTLQYILSEVYAPAIPRAAHRLDAGTTGVMVFARSKHFRGLLQPQFANGLVEKIYLARVKGQPEWESYTCELAISEEATENGARDTAEDGLAARTHFKVLKRFSDGTTLLEVRPLTGRTNQIRVHLWKLGMPICGDRHYLEGQQKGTGLTGDVHAAPLSLHAYKISFKHPVSNQQVDFSAPPPTQIEYQA